VVALLIHTLVPQNLVRERDANLTQRAAALHQTLDFGNEGCEIGQVIMGSLQLPVNEVLVSGTRSQVIDERGHTTANFANI
jgi:hypothetical protein